MINNLALTGAAHLQFVYGDVGSLRELEVQADDNSIFGDPWVYTGDRDHGGTELTDETNEDPTTSINFEDVITNPERYVRIVLPLRDEQTPEFVWELLKNINTALQAAMADLGVTLDYDIDQNSNSFARTLLDIIGVPEMDVDTVFDTSEIGSLLISSFPGYGRNVLNSAKVNGTSSEIRGIGLNLTGTDGNDFIQLGNGDNTIIGGVGNDTLIGRGGSDIIDAGGGDDSVVAGEGNDTVIGGTGNDVLDGGENIACHRTGALCRPYAVLMTPFSL